MNNRNRPQPGTVPAKKDKGIVREWALALAAIGLLSYTACTAEKTSMNKQTVNTVAVVKPEVPPAGAGKEVPKLVDGVFAASDHLLAVYFDLNKSTLSEAAMEAVKANADWLKTQPPFLVRVVGFADSRGSLKKNARLAGLRATNVRNAYVALGLPKERISAIKQGAEESACQPITEDCLSKSRRSETLIEEKSLASR